MLGSLILYLKGMRIMMFQLSGYYHTSAIKAPLKGEGLGFRGFRVQGLGLLLPFFHSLLTKGGFKVIGAP